jgi:hypothetical protein
VLLRHGSFSKIESIRISNAIVPQSRWEYTPWAAEATSLLPAGPAACPRLASPVGSRQATGPRRRARLGRAAGDGQPVRLERGWPLRGPRTGKTPDPSASRLLSRMSRLRIAVPRLAAIDCGVRPPRSGGAAIAAREQPPPAGAGGESGEAKMPFEILILNSPAISRVSFPIRHLF